MKTINILIMVIIVAFILFQLFTIENQKDIESYSYKVEQTFNEFEIRTYKESFFSTVTLPTNSYKEASSKGFSLLAKYIFGSNEKNEKIPQKTMDAITFGGWANDEKIKDYKSKLTIALASKDIKYSNKFYFFGYNPPYDIINRKNEILVELTIDE